MVSINLFADTHPSDTYLIRASIVNLSGLANVDVHGSGADLDVGKH